MKNKYKIIDLFCGAGGFSEGFRQTSRVDIVLAIDNYRAAALTYKTNFPETIVLLEDIKIINKKHLLDLINDTDIDIVIGSPPCEPYTGANPRRYRNPLDRLYKDPTGQLTLHYIRIVGIIKPRIFIMENVPAIIDDGLKHALIREFKKIGYDKIFFNTLYAEKYRTPSKRKRIFISNIEIRPIPVEEEITVYQALKDLPSPGDYPPNHQKPPPPSPRKLKRIARLRWGQAMIYYEGASKRLPNLIKLDPYRVAPTVLGSSRFIHPFENRLLTVREQARLMGFPDQFIFIGGRDEQYNLVGEAVPVPLAYSIAEYVIDKLDRGEI